MPEKEIIKLHREVFEYLTEKRKGISYLNFTLKNEDFQRVKKGFFFDNSAKDKEAAKFSFWDFSDNFFGCILL
jgi:hypothetical protein